MEYLQTKSSKFVRFLKVSEQGQGVTVFFNKRFDTEHDHIQCSFFIEQPDDTPRPLGPGLEQFNNTFTSVSFNPNPAQPEGSKIMFIVHGSFFDGKAQYAAHGYILAPQNHIPKFDIPHHKGEGPHKVEEKLPIVFPTGNMKDDPNFQRLLDEEVKKTNDPELTADFIKRNPRHPKVRKITMSATKRFRLDHPKEAAEHDALEQKKLPNIDKNTDSDDYLANFNLSERDTDPIQMSVEAEIDRRVSEHEKNLTHITDLKEKNRRLVEYRGEVTTNVMDMFVADTRWTEKSKAFAEHGGWFGNQVQAAYERQQKAAAQGINNRRADQKRKWFSGTTSNVGKVFRSRGGTNYTNSENGEIYASQGNMPEDYYSEDDHIPEGLYSASATTPEAAAKQLQDLQNSGQDNGQEQPTNNQSQTNTNTPHNNRSRWGQSDRKPKNEGDEVKKAFRVFKVARFFGTSAWVIIIPFIFIILFTAITDLTGNNDTTNANPNNTITVTKDGPASIPSEKQEIPYTISAQSTDGSDIQLSDPIPDNATFVSASNNPTLQDASGNITTATANVKTVIWNLSAADAQSGVSLKVKPKSNNSYVINQANAQSTGSSNNGDNSFDGKNISATKKTCGKWGPNDGALYPITINPKQENYGDPICDFNKNDLYALLKKQDSQNADYWFNVVLPCESHLEPNAYLAASESHLGAYGLFQMNPSGKGNGKYDAGDVYWKLQLTNAITYKNTMIGGNFSYWQCANNNPKKVQ